MRRPYPTTNADVFYSKRDVVEVFLLRVSTVIFTLLEILGKTPTSSSSGFCRSLIRGGGSLCRRQRICAAAQKLYGIGNHVHRAALPTILSLPRAVLEASFDEN